MSAPAAGKLKAAKPITNERLEAFFSTALELAEQADRGAKIETAAKGGYVKPAQYVRKADALEDERLREMAREVVFGIWNEQKRAAKLDEIYHGVLRKIAEDIESGEWPRLWNPHPLKRTVDRRVGELHELNSRFWGSFDCPPCICIKAGYAQPNPMIFDDATRTDIVKAAQP